MQMIYQGKTKDVFDLEDGTYLLRFKDDLTGENGVFDPGSNQVGLSVDGAGMAGLKMTVHYMNLLNAKGVKTHFVSADIDQATMTVLPAEQLGFGLEVICRFKAVGSFIRRYGAYIQSGASLPEYVELTLKDDEKGDPLINEEALLALNILQPGEYAVIADMARKIARVVYDDLAAKGMELYDVKFEFGRVKGEIYLIDEISGGSMRVYKDGSALDDPLVLSAMVAGDGT
ncbi:MAG: phosphoribosylaminoimidazolesuccinocarboxamide synthase [Clostridiales bacterium]|nr:phosphoribosylaminoimidazolesuccinocarboxamide synthase [Clostridiales bacterium]